MPFINSRVSVPMTEQQKESLKQQLGEAISIIPGKSEQWLMLEFADNCDLYFQGDNTLPAAFVEIKVFGSIPTDSLDKMTKTICGIYEECLQIKKDRIYVKYEESCKWGWNGSNF
jgi:hypothetical protein